MLIGLSGSGESTILRLIIGLSQPTSGEVRFEGRVLAPENILELRRNRHGSPASPRSRRKGSLLQIAANLVNIAPGPPLAGFHRPDYGMLRLVKMLGRVAFG